MKIAALLSGGKDSIFSFMHCKGLGHEIIALGNLFPPVSVSDAGSSALNSPTESSNDGDKDEVDSWMFQSIGHDLIAGIAKCLDLPLYRQRLDRKSVQVGSVYRENDQDEVEDLALLLQNIQANHPDLQGICTGAILSSYQRTRVEHVCERLGLVSIGPLWMHDQALLLQDMITMNIGAILVKVAAVGLDDQDLGKTITQIHPKLTKLNKLYSLHVCGEGGEYETFTLDAPCFKKKLVVKESKIVLHSEGVWYLKVKNWEIHDKEYNHHWLDDMKELIKTRYSNLPQMDLMPKYSINSESNYTNLLVDNRCKVVVSKKANFMAISGLCTAIVDIEQDAKTILGMIDDLLVQQNVQKSDIIQLTVYLQNMDHFASLNKVYKSYFDQPNPPTRVTVQAIIKDSLQIDLILCQSKITQHSHLHVQGISYWAPSNIGPYSQAVQSLDCLWMSGMIGLVPSTMEMAEPLLQSLQSLSSCDNVARAMGSSINELSLFCTCYLSPSACMDVALHVWNEMDEDDGIRPLFITVPKLPKNATIEWHVGLFSPVGWKNILANDAETDPSLSLNVPIRKVAMNQVEQQGWNGFVQTCSQGYTEFVTGFACQSGTGSLCDLSRNLLLEMIKTVEEVKSIINIKLFYTQAQVEANELQQSVLDIFSTSVAITLVPVLAIQGNHTNTIGMVLFSHKL